MPPLRTLLASRSPMAMLYSYCIRIDDGAAPNPYWGVCTLAICKPVIRRLAQRGDWVVGTGSKNAPGQDRSGELVYAMEITEPPMTWEDYARHVTKNCPGKVPNLKSDDPRHWAGDAIYKFRGGKAKLLRSVHGEENRERDLGGKNVLLSTRFYYFGRESVRLPGRLQGIVKQGQGHRSKSNQEYLKPFVNWITRQYGQASLILGEPQMPIQLTAQGSGCAAMRPKCADENEDIRTRGC